MGKRACHGGICEHVHQLVLEEPKTVEMAVHRQNDLGRGDFSRICGRGPIATALQSCDGAVLKNFHTIRGQAVCYAAHKGGGLDNSRARRVEPPEIVIRASQLFHRLCVEYV